MSPSVNCGLTVLRTVGAARATKQWRWNAKKAEWSKISYTAGAWFTPAEHKVRSLDELAAVLERVQLDPSAFVVRGALAPDAAAALAANPLHRIRRRKHSKNGIDPSLVEVPRSWIMIDIDNWPLPTWADLVDDPDAAIDHAIYELLPKQFHDVACWWQLSSSAGFAHGYLKVHLFFWLSAPATNDHLKRVLEQHAPGVDRAPFNAAQPHYIAAPIIQGGHDPLPRRTGWRKGLDTEAVLPDLAPEQPRPRPTNMGSAGGAGGVLDALAFLGHGEGGQGFHAPLRVATLRYARQCARSGERDDDAVKAMLRMAIRSAPRRPGGNVEVPYCQDWYLDPMIAGAFALLAGDAEIQTMTPHHTSPTGDVDQARKDLKAHVSGFLGRALAWHALDESEQVDQQAEHSALIVDVGTGKTRITREALGDFIASAKASSRPHRVLWLVPTHKLGDETFIEMKRLGLAVAVMRGREADEPGTGDPETEEPPQKMCLNLPAVQDAMDAGYDAETAACGKGKAGSLMCPYRGECAYQRQKPSVARADVVIASHQSLFHRLPKEVSRGLAVIVADESWWQSGIRPNQEMQLASFSEEPLVHPVLSVDKISAALSRYRVDESATNDLNALSTKAQKAFSTIDEEGFVSRDAITAAGLTADDCAEAIKLEWRRKRDGLIWPGQAPADRRKALEQAAGNLTIPRRAAIWEILHELLDGNETHTGRLQIATRSNRGGPFRAILVHTRAAIRDNIASLPILLLDATMPVQVVRHYLPRLNVLAEVKAAAPHMTVHQIIGGWGKTSIVPSDKAADEENRRRLGLISELADFVRANSGGNGLLITYQAIEERFAIPGILTGHFNAIAGLDTFGGVRSLFVIGRPLPDPRELRPAALALTGRPIPVEAPHQETRGALMADKSGLAINVRAYADPDLEALRTAISDAEVVQAIGRGRGINRTANTPLDVFVFADVALPLLINRLVRWPDVRLDPIGRMAARGAVFASPADAAKAYPDLFPTVEAAKKALQRSKPKTDFGDIPLGYIYLRGMSPKYPWLVTYRPQGRGQQTRTATVAGDRVEGFRAQLETLMGTLTVYEVSEIPGSPPPPPTPTPNPPPHAPDDMDCPFDTPPDDPGWEPEGWQPDPDLDPHQPDWTDVLDHWVQQTEIAHDFPFVAEVRSSAAPPPL